MLRRWRAAWPKRSKRFDPPWPQGPQTQPFPAVHKPAGARPLRFPARPRRGRFIEPAWPQASQATPPPSIYDQAGARPRFAPKLRRGHFHEPPWPQGSTATPPPAIYHGAGPRPIRFPPLPRRGRSFEPPWPQGPQSAPPPQFARARIRALPPTRRSRVLSQPPATPTGTVPPFMCTRRAPVRLARRGVIAWTPPAASTLPVVELLLTNATILAGWWNAQEMAGWWFAKLGPGGTMQSQSAQSLQYVPFAVTATLGDPTGYEVEVAFTTPATAGPSDWVAAAWLIDPGISLAANTYVLQCLVGPGGAAALSRGQYTAWVRIVGNPEIPVLSAGTLTIS